jgi:hypothetical protein
MEPGDAGARRHGGGGGGGGVEAGCAGWVRCGLEEEARWWWLEEARGLLADEAPCHGVRQM